MNITFLIGNGFDLNLGLNTKYTDFLEEYLKENPDDTDEINIFKKDIKRQEEEDRRNDKGSERFWSYAELAFGRYTIEVVEQQKTVEAFLERHEGFCSRLAAYLQSQETHVQIKGKEQDFIDSILGFHGGLSEIQRTQIDEAETVFDGGYVFNFIIFNYTEIVDKIVESIRKSKAGLGARTYKNNPL